MSLPSTNNFTDLNNLMLNDSLGLQFTGRSADPTDSDLAEGRLYYKTSVGLRVYNGSTWTTLGSGGGGGTPTWEDIYTNDPTWAMGGALSITQGNNASVFSINKTANGAGTVIAVTNSGTGKDITGNGAYWSLVTSATHGILELGSTGTINATDGALTIGKTATATTVAGTLTVAEAVTATASVTITGTADTNVFTITDGDILVSNGKIALTNDDTDAAITVTGNSVTTGSVVSVTANGVTSGDMVLLTTTDAGFSGNFIRITDGSDVFTVGDEGLTTIAGTAGSTMLAITAGNIVTSAGGLSLTKAADSATLSVTNNTATTASVVVIAGSGVFTGSTTTSFLTLTQSGITSGTAVYVALAALDSGKGVHVVANALTTGELVHLAHTTSVIADGGSMLRISSTSIDTGGATNGTLIDLSSTSQVAGSLVKLVAGAVTTGVLVDLSSTTGMTSGSIIRATTSTAGAVATNGVISIRATGAFTSTANAGLLDVQASAAVGDATIVNIKATNGSQISNTALNVEQTTTTTGYTGDFVRIVGTSTTGDSNLIAVTCASTTAGDALQITGNGLVAGTSTLVNLVHGTSVLGAGNSMLRITSTGADTGTTTGCLVDLASSTATAGTLVLVTSATLATGSAMVMNLNGLTTGAGLKIAHTTSVIASGGSLARLSSTSVDTSTTTGSLLDLSATATAVGTLALLTDTGLTTGCAVKIAHTTTVIASGGSLLRVASTSVDTSTTTGCLVDLTSTAGTTGHLVMLTSATLTTGNGLLMTLNGLTSGSGIAIVSSSADTTARGLIQLTSSSTSATGASAIRFTMALQSTNFRKVMTDSVSGVTLWFGNGTTGNGNLAATTGDILINGGSNKPEYCTNGGGSTWSALV